MTLQSFDEHRAEPAASKTADLQAEIASWVMMKRQVIEREDVAPILAAIKELRDLDQTLKSKTRAAYRVRWALVKRASFADLSALARKLLPWVLDAINTQGGFIGWRNWIAFAELLGEDKDRISKAAKELEDADLIRRTLPHRNRLIWAAKDAAITSGDRGPSYTFGRANFPTFAALLAADEDAWLGTTDDLKLQQGATSEASIGESGSFEVAPECNFKTAEVAPGCNLPPLEVANSSDTRGTSQLKGTSQPKEPVSGRAAPPSDEGSATSDQGNETLQGRGELLPIKATKEVLAPIIGAGTLLSGEAYVVEGVRLPLALCVFIEKRQAPMMLLTLYEAIRDQRSKGVPPDAIREALVQAIGKADGDTPSAIVGKCITFVSNVSKFRASDAAKQATDKAAAERLKDFEKVVTLKCGDSFVQITGREVNELLDKHQGVVTANEIVAEFKAEAENSNASAEDVRQRLSDRASDRKDAASWREIIKLRDPSDASYVVFAGRMRAALEAARADRTLGSLARMIAHPSPLDWGRWFVANELRMRQMLRGFACTQQELLALAVFGEDLFAATTAHARGIAGTLNLLRLTSPAFGDRFRELGEGFDDFTDDQPDALADVLVKKFPEWTPPASQAAGTGRSFAA